jgi:hypothetical protein
MHNYNVAFVKISRYSCIITFIFSLSYPILSLEGIVATVQKPTVFIFSSDTVCSENAILFFLPYPILAPAQRGKLQYKIQRAYFLVGYVPKFEMFNGICPVKSWRIFSLQAVYWAALGYNVLLF